MTQDNSEQDLLQSEDAKKIIENLLFITDRPLTPKRIAEVAEGIKQEGVIDIITELQREYAATGRAVQIVEIAGGFQMSTKPEYGRWVRRLYNEKMTAKLSNAALETLAIIAYKQPVTRAEVEAIRGVDIGGPLEKLLERGLVRVLGKRDTIGKPMVYGTTDEFLRLFGLNKVSDLPDLDIFAAKTAPKDEQGNLPFEDSSSAAIIPLDDEDLAEIAAGQDIFTHGPSDSDGEPGGTEIAAVLNAEDTLPQEEAQQETETQTQQEKETEI